MEKIKLEEVKRIDREKRTITITLRTTPTISKWMSENSISPTKVFHKAVETLMN